MKTAHQQQAEDIAADTAKFMASGGTIQRERTDYTIDERIEHINVRRDISAPAKAKMIKRLRGEG